MNLKHLSFGAICLLVGITILSPFDEIFILLPLSTVVGPEIFPVVMIIGVILLSIGIVFVGKSTLYHFGLIGRAIAHHPRIILGSIFVISLLVYLWLL